MYRYHPYSSNRGGTLNKSAGPGDHAPHINFTHVNGDIQIELKKVIQSGVERSLLLIPEKFFEISHESDDIFEAGKAIAGYHGKNSETHPPSAVGPFKFILRSDYDNDKYEHMYEWAVPNSQLRVSVRNRRSDGKRPKDTQFVVEVRVFGSNGLPTDEGIMMAWHNFNADDYTQGYYQSKAMVDSNGHVFWPPPAKFRSSCKIDVTFFPFDDQLCKLKFGSWTYDAAQVNLTKRRDHVDMTNYIRSGEWHIVHIEIKRNDVTYPCCPEIYYPDVTIYVHIRRRVLYYLFNIIFPCIWLSILSLLGFWLPPDSGEKITLGITVLLAFSVFMLLIAESMPATSEMVPLIEIYLTIVMALTSLSIVLTVYVLQLHHSGPVVIPIPHSFKYSLVRYVVPVIRMKKVVETYAQEHNLIETDEVYQCFAKPKTKPIDSPLINNKKNFIFEKKKNIKYRQNNSYREEPQCNDNDNDNDDDDDDDKEIMKEFLSNPSLCNGDIRSVPSFNKRSPNQHHHRSRSRVPQIVLIPQQSHPLSSSPRNLINHTQYECFNSNMSLLEKHLKHLINKQKHEEEKNEIINEWKLMALIMDRLLFWIFIYLSILIRVLCLIIIPCLKNVGFIPALSKDLTMDYKSVETLRNVVEEQIKPNLTGTSG
ncbi:unnamed protein product [Rotaria sp. Silwood2]|nr:unnamed protein product [Rotaria sp. Silwood2]